MIVFDLICSIFTYHPTTHIVNWQISCCARNEDDNEMVNEMMVNCETDIKDQPSHHLMINHQPSHTSHIHHLMFQKWWILDIEITHYHLQMRKWWDGFEEMKWFWGDGKVEMIKLMIIFLSLKPSSGEIYIPPNPNWAAFLYILG